MNILQTIPAPDPHKAALAFSAILAADKGYASEVKEHGQGWIVLVEDGKAIVFVSNSNGTNKT
jgi:hypothetical protein